MKEKTKADLIKDLAKLLRLNKTLSKKIEQLSAQHTPDKDENLFSKIFEQAKIGIVIVNESGKIISVNKYVTKTTGYTIDELTNMEIADFTHPHDVKTSEILFEELLKGKRDYYVIEKRYIKKDGHILWAKSTASTIKDKKSKKNYFLVFIEDISRQREIEKKLAGEEKLIRLLMQNLPDSIYFKDIDSKFIKVNYNKASKHGYSNPDDMIGKSDFDLYSREHASEALNDEQEIIKTGKPIIDKEEKISDISGRSYWVSTTKLPLYNEDGSIGGTFGITRDITTKKEIEIKLYESEERYRGLFESSADAIFIMTDIFEDCNDAVLQLFGCDREDLIGHHPAEFSPTFQPDGKDSIKKANEKIELAMKGTPQHFYWKHIKKDGTPIDAEVTLNSLTLNGRTLLQATVRDIGERVYAEKIQNAVYEISEAVNVTKDINFLYKRIHEIISTLMPAKNFYIALYNKEKEMLTFPYFVDEFDPPQPPKKLGKGLTEYVLRKGEAVLINAKKDLELREQGEVELIGEPQAIWLGIPLIISGKIIGVMVVQDYNNEKAYGEDEKQLLIFVSEQIAQAIERKANLDAIKSYAEELKQLNATKDKFFSIIAHDLKNPFITILGFSDLLLTDFNELTDEEKLFYIEEMKKSADVSHNLLQNLLQWSRSQTGRIEFKPKNLTLVDIVNENALLLKLIAQKKQININISIDPSTSVFADEDMLNTIIRNLISNAIKFTNRDGNVNIYSSTYEKFVQVTVEDNGVGMDESTRSKLFKLDETHSTFGTENESGTGLGLLLCKEFVEKHGGNINVESSPGVGSKFIFTLPTQIH
ncbi:MAG: PAS domain S-box protein [Bacteroidota bacterium]